MRRWAETLMTDRIRVTAPGTVTVDPNTGAETVAQNVVYDGKGKVVESADPALVGRRFRLVNMQSEKTHATARRWNVQEIPMEGGS